MDAYNMFDEDAHAADAESPTAATSGTASPSTTVPHLVTPATPPSTHGERRPSLILAHPPCAAGVSYGR